MPKYVKTIAPMRTCFAARHLEQVLARRLFPRSRNSQSGNLDIQRVQPRSIVTDADADTEDDMNVQRKT